MKVAILGSANLDLVYEVERIPAPGETVLARGFASYPGGKGNNQAVAAVRAGADTVFIVALGPDDAGRRLDTEARAAGIDVRPRYPGGPTGTAVIYVDRHGENSIVVNSGANAALTKLSTTDLAAIDTADVLVLQMETPVRTVAKAIAEAKTTGTAVVLNAAPSGAVTRRLVSQVDVLIVNEHEAAEIVGEACDAAELVSELTAQGCAVIVTLGAAGALVGVPGAAPVRVPAYEVDAVDTTGAGDAFVGAFAAVFDGTGLEALVDATGFATAAAAIAVQRKGAVPSIPTLEEVLEFREGR
ncbi:ribokinase [Glycomyces tenuis]|uniref:ribokinase n=1 Tax=Glycomyces tenuis TaxID=58116 RepID=UPI00041AE638|nr:ribokinase [Glycomyces tenuis]